MSGSYEDAVDLVFGTNGNRAQGDLHIFNKLDQVLGSSGALSAGREDGDFDCQVIQ